LRFPTAKRARKFFTRLYAEYFRLAKLLAFDLLFAGNSFAGLVSYRAAGFACGLTGASAFAAARNLSFSGFRDRFDHSSFSSINKIPKFIMLLL
jgi:hypothetical protein